MQVVKQVNYEVKTVEPCDQWYQYQDSQEYDNNDLDKTQLLYYSFCLREQHFNFKDQDGMMVLECTYLKLQQLIKYFEFISPNDVLNQEDIISCENSCNINAKCGDQCLQLIADNYDESEGVCVQIKEDQIDDVQKGLTDDENDWFRSTAMDYQMCIQQVYNTYFTDGQNLDLNLIEDQYENTPKLEIDYGIYENANTEQTAFLSLKCRENCYDYEQLYDSDFEMIQYNYNNDFLYDTIYGGDYWENKDKQDQLDFFYGEDFYEGVDCEGDDCFDKNGNYIGGAYEQDSEEEESPCEDEYCFIEFFGCIDRCTKKNCPKDTCFDGQIEETLEAKIDQNCEDFIQLTLEFTNNDIIQSDNIVPPKYYDSYNKCIDNLIQRENNNQARSQEDKQYIQDYYSCLISCTEEEVFKQEDNKNNTSQIVFFTIGTFITIILIFL